MYFKSESVEEINFLASAKYLNFTRQIENEGVEADENGKKIVKAGTVYRNEDGEAIGLVFDDVDVTNGPQPGAVMYEGWVYASKLPETVSEADKATMTGIHFKDEYENKKKTSIKVAVQNQETTLLNKNVSDMISEDTTILADGTVSGTLKKVENFKDFSSKKEEQSGYYFPFKLEGTGSKMTFKKNGIETKKDIAFDKDVIFRTTKTDVWEVLVDDQRVVKLNFEIANFE